MVILLGLPIGVKQGARRKLETPSCDLSKNVPQKRGGDKKIIDDYIFIGQKVWVP